MLVSLSQAFGDYLQNVFIAKLNWWVLLGFVGQGLFSMRFVVQWLASGGSAAAWCRLHSGSFRSAAAS